MKQKTLIIGMMLLTQGIISSAVAQVRQEIKIPDLKGYTTLKCDFHIHTVFSDGLVWPTVRVDEAYREGLDAIAITDHLEYRPHKGDIVAGHGRSYEIAEKAADKNNILLIRGSEITRPMAPGHFNAIFLNNNDSLDKKEWRDSFKAAKAQRAFIFWNHPGWDAQQPDTTKWWPEHTELYNAGYMNGIEVANGTSYCPEAFRWCLEKKLTMLGNTDIHQPIQAEYEFAKGKHRTMTLVFAKNRTIEGIKEALINRRTAVYVGDNLIGENKYLKELFENSIEILDVEKSKRGVQITFINKSDLTFKLLKTEHNPDVVYFRDYVIEPNCRHSIMVKLQNDVEEGDVNFEVTNLLVEPGQGLKYTYHVSKR
ncbi:Sb-PDE family phosphodiesterase [Bacteroides sedimenti]|uniref:Histidinol-phosphatase n=1 Tax=Bacteroides sedimenti TaxID=2136147 RepID=A0ABM8IAJ9_9BACE